MAMPKTIQFPGSYTSPGSGSDSAPKSHPSSQQIVSIIIPNRGLLVQALLTKPLHLTSSAEYGAPAVLGLQKDILTALMGEDPLNALKSIGGTISQASGLKLFNPTAYRFVFTKSDPFKLDLDLGFVSYDWKNPDTGEGGGENTVYRPAMALWASCFMRSIGDVPQETKNMQFMAIPPGTTGLWIFGSSFSGSSDYVHVALGEIDATEFTNMLEQERAGNPGNVDRWLREWGSKNPGRLFMFLSPTRCDLQFSRSIDKDGYPLACTARYSLVYNDVILVDHNGGLPFSQSNSAIGDIPDETFDMVYTGNRPKGGA